MLNYLTEFDEIYLRFIINWWGSLFGSTHINDRGYDGITLRWVVRKWVVWMKC
jgi:hypothetical protein